VTPASASDAGKAAASGVVPAASSGASGSKSTSRFFSLGIFTSSVWVVSEFLVRRHAAKPVRAQDPFQKPSQFADRIDAR
jgi:hypothetical protein